MSANRTFNFMGQAYGSTPVTVTATMAGTQIFSGEVPTINEPLPTTPPAPEQQVVLFQLSDSQPLNTDFAGNVAMEITVAGGSGVVFGEIDSNYYVGNVGNIANPNPGNYGTPGNFVLCYFGQPTNSESTPDPRSSVVINGQQQVPPNPPSAGCFNWIVPTDSIMNYNWNITIGMNGTAIGNTANYTGGLTPVPNFPPTPA